MDNLSIRQDRPGCNRAGVHFLGVDKLNLVESETYGRGQIGAFHGPAIRGVTLRLRRAGVDAVSTSAAGQILRNAGNFGGMLSGLCQWAYVQWLHERARSRRAAS